MWIQDPDGIRIVLVESRPVTRCAATRDRLDLLLRKPTYRERRRDHALAARRAAHADYLTVQAGIGSSARLWCVRA